MTVAARLEAADARRRQAPQGSPRQQLSAQPLHHRAVRTNIDFDLSKVNYTLKEIKLSTNSSGDTLNNSYCMLSWVPKRYTRT